MANPISRQDSRRSGRSKRDGRERAPRDETGDDKWRHPLPAAPAGQELSLLWSAVPGLAALVLYLSQAPPVSGDKDASEFTLVLATNGIAHETGYAVYSLLGHLFVRACHAAGTTWAWGANAWSAVGGSVAIFALHGLSVRLIPAELGFGRAVVFLAGLLPTTLFGLNPIWTYETTLAEVYSWHIALCLILALVFALNVRGINSGRLVFGSAQALWRAACWGLLCGLAGTHHTTAVFVAGPLSLILLFTLWRRSHTVWREVLAVAAGVCLPVAASAGFVGWRAFHPARWQWPLLAPTWRSVQDHLLATRFRSSIGAFAPGPEQQVYLADYVYPYLAVFLALTLCAVVLSLHQKDATVICGLASVALLGTVFAFQYGVPDPSSYFLLPMAFASTGLVSLGGLLAARGPLFRRGTVLATAVAMVITLLLATRWVSTAHERRTVFVRWDQEIRGMWDSIPFDKAIVIWPNDISTKLVERQILFGEKPGIDVINPNLLGHEFPRRKFIERHGFDPVSSHAEDARTRTEFVELTTQRINEASSLPVIDFRPEEKSVRLLRKP